MPLVVESCIYDLGCGDNVRPDAAMGYAACQASESGDFRQGCYGAGTGATVGKLCGPDYMMKSGLNLINKKGLLRSHLFASAEDEG